MKENHSIHGVITILIFGSLVGLMTILTYVNWNLYQKTGKIMSLLTSGFAGIVAIVVFFMFFYIMRMHLKEEK